MNTIGINRSKLRFYPDRISGEKRPITADVFLTNYCNNKCQYCNYHRWEYDDSSRYMHYDDFVEYINRLIDIGVKGVILTGGGEPTINPDFDRITEWLECNNISYGINTNFNLLKYIKPKYIKVSLDGWDERTYLDIRGVDRYHQVRCNILDYNTWKTAQLITTKIGIQKIVRSPDEVFDFYNGNKDLPFDYMSLRPIESTAGEYYKVAAHSNVVADIVRNIEEICKNDQRVILHYKWNMVFDNPDECSAHWSQIAIDERGRVMFCCHKPNEIIGHIMEDNIMDMIETAKTDIASCDVPCRLSGANSYLKEIMMPADDICFI